MSEWISVDDRLPVEDEDVVVLLPDTFYVRSRMLVCVWVAGKFIDGIDYDSWAPTHWMPLPQPPEGV